VDDEIRELVMRGYETARQLLETHRGAVRALAEELLEVESLDADEIRRVLGSNGAASPAAPLEQRA
jgi:ATP-dependent Zn protease